jgi:hypothetical protein
VGFPLEERCHLEGFHRGHHHFLVCRRRRRLLSLLSPATLVAKRPRFSSSLSLALMRQLRLLLAAPQALIVLDY